MSAERDPDEALVPGVHERLITAAVARAMARRAAEGRPVRADNVELDAWSAALVRYVGDRLARALAALPPPARGQPPEAQLTVVHRVLEAIDGAETGAVVLPDDLPEQVQALLTWVGPTPDGVTVPEPPLLPHHGLVQPSLLFGGRQEVTLLGELTRELGSADRVDAVVAFLKFSGVRLLKPALQAFLARGGVLRLIVSTYTGATDARAVEEMVGLRARLRVAYEADGTRLHAKAWLFARRSGLSTAYVGSSNLSRSALTDGAEWNVRVTEAVTPTVVERVSAAFEQLWEQLGPNDHTAEDHARLKAALGTSARPEGQVLRFDAEPKPHQRDVLDALETERMNGHRRSLVVAATGTGKTWVSAFDYARLKRAGAARTMLFIAHRREILKTSRDVFRAVLQDPGFGELWVDGERPANGHHVFAAIQSLSADRVSQLEPAAFDYVVVDEFHHAAAPTYRRLLERLAPKWLLGLTATPERADGQSVLRWFDHRVAAEIRLWDALEAGLLAPFHYFGVVDPTSAERAWSRGRLDPGMLDGVYGADDARAGAVFNAVGRYVADPSRMRAIGFCVGVAHAARMARAFRERKLAAEAIDGGTPTDQREAAIRALRAGTIQALFVVDLFNEGVDIPEVDTILFLRPTESATVFLQQLGRGLRRCEGKAQLTVLDMVGQVHQEYRYHTRYAAILPGTRKQVLEQIERGFPRLPAGVAMVLEPAAREVVLASVRRFLGGGKWRVWVEDLRRSPARINLKTWLTASDAELTDVFDPHEFRSWSRLRRDAGHELRPELPGEPELRRRLSRLLHVDDSARLRGWSAWLERSEAPWVSTLTPEQLALARMLVAAAGDRRRPLDALQDELDRIWSFQVVREEWVELLAVLADAVRHPTRPLGPTGAIPVAVHGTYTRAEVIAAWGAAARGRMVESREGTLYVPHAKTELLFVTLDKSESSFRPSIRYADYPISERRFQWESQNGTHAGTEVGRRYVEHAARGVRMILFVRLRPSDARGQAAPFTCLGDARYLRHEGARPMRIVWELETPMPGWMLEAARAVA